MFPLQFETLHLRAIKLHEENDVVKLQYIEHRDSLDHDSKTIYQFVWITFYIMSISFKNDLVWL